MQFRKPEHVGAFDNHRVCVRNVNSRFNDRSADENVDFPFDEQPHDTFEFGTAHLSVGDGDACAGSERADLLRRLFDGVHAVVNVENLSAASQLPRKRGGNERFLLLGDDRMDRQTARRRGGNRAQIAQTGHGHVERSRNRGRSHGQHIDGRADRLEFFLVLHAETLFLVDDDESEFMEFDFASDERMRSDDDVYGAVRQTFDNLFALLSHFVTGQSFNDNRKLREAFRKTQIVLLRQNRRRHQHGDLFAGNRAFERRTHRDFRLAVADVAAEQTVHRAR